MSQNLGFVWSDKIILKTISLMLNGCASSQIRLALIKRLIFQQQQKTSIIGVRVGVFVPNATSSNISIISWRSFLLTEEAGVPGENH